MYKFPVKLPPNLKLRVTQPYRVPSPLPLSSTFAVTQTEHRGIDIDCGTPEQTWGQECVWPFPWKGIVWGAKVDSPMGATKAAHSQIDTTDPLTGIQYSVVYLHLSSVTKTKEITENKVITYSQGDVIGRIGNNGAVYPAPTPSQPYNGTHLHLALGVKKPGELNYIMVDPALYFDTNDWYGKEASPYDKLIAIADQMQATNPKQAAIVRAVAGIIRAFT